MNTHVKEILVLGDGDFSYSNSLVSSSLECNLTSTVFLSRQEIISTYGNDVQRNIQSLEEKGVKVLFSVDATNLPPLLCNRQYDSIHFNFPHTGGKGKISENRKLLIDLFKSLQTVVKETGNVEIALLPGQGGTEADGQALRSKGNNWNIQEAAAISGFILYSVEKFGADFYNLTGYRGRSKAFFCDSGLRHKFKIQSFNSSSLTRVLKSTQPESYIQKYLENYSLASQSLSYRCNNNLGNFDELFSIYVNTNENECERASKRAKLEHQEDVGNHILKLTGLQSKKLIFYPFNKTKVLYPPCIRHDVSMWTESADTPNIVPVLLECVGLALHQVTKREPEPFFNTKTQKYSHCFSITYSHPFEALSEEYVKHLAHVTVRDCLAKSGFDLH